MRTKDLKKFYTAKGYRNLDELALAAGFTDRTHMTNALNRKDGHRLSREKTECIAKLLDLRPEEIDENYRLLVELEPYEWEIVQLLREVEPPRMRRKIASGIRSMLRDHTASDAE